MTVWRNHRSRLSSIVVTLCETDVLRDVLQNIVNDMEAEQFADQSAMNISELQTKVTNLTARVEVLMTRERSMDEAGTEAKIRPAVHRALDRIEGHPTDGGGDAG